MSAVASSRTPVIAASLVLTMASSATLAPGVNAQGAGRCAFYEYKAQIVRVVDGDTVDADIDLGFRVWVRNERLRLHGIDAPETRGPEKPDGLKSKAALKHLLEGQWVTLCTLKGRAADKRGKYGRYLAIIWLNDMNVNDWMVRKGLAKEARY